MKKDFTFIMPLPTHGKLIKCPGELEVSGIGTCDHPRDTDSYDYEITDVTLIVNGVRAPFMDILQSLFNGEVRNYKEIHHATISHLMFRFNEKDEPEHTDYSQQLNPIIQSIVDNFKSPAA